MERLSTKLIVPSIGDEQTWHQARQRLEQLFRAAKLGDDRLPRSILLLGSNRSTGLEQLDTSFRAFVEAQPGCLLELSCLQPGLISFWSVQRLLDLLAPVIASEKPDLLQRCGAEIRAIHPELATAFEVNAALSIDHVAVTPSERRSHRESEQAFRIINRVCSLVIEAQQACPSLSRGPLVIWWRHLHEADRPSLLTFRRLSRWINHAHAPILLIGSLDPDAEPTFEEPDLPADIQRYFDWRAEHRQLLQAVRSQLLGEEIAVDIDRPVAGEQVAPISIGDLPISELDGARTMLLALSKFQQGAVEEGCAYALHAMRLAVFALNVEAIMLLGQQIFAHLQTLDEQSFAVERFSELWQRLTAHDHYAALEFATAGLQRRQDVIMATWKAVALAQTFLEHHQAAIECYQRALELADTPAMRAQLHMYLGLMVGKRLRDGQRAQAYLQQGFSEIEGIENPEACLERGWLFNVSALMTYQMGRYREAMTMVQNALATMKPLHQSEATYLKINLISNMSVLLEDTKQLQHALDIWTFFRNFLSTANEVFAKHYFFREGGLRVQMGDLAGALESYQQSYEYAQAIDDGFHMEVAARACGYANYRLGRFDEAHRWFAESAALRQRIGDYENLPEASSAQALCLYQLERPEAAQELLGQSEKLCRDFGLGWLASVQQGQECLDQRSPAALAEWEHGVLRAPSTKLNRPFYLINLYR